MLARHVHFIASAFASAMLAIGLAACSHQSHGDASAPASESAAGQLLGAEPWMAMAPGRSGLPRPGRMFYPLAVGNRWDYDVASHITLVTDAGPQPPEISHHGLQSTITGMQLAGEREYFLQQDIDELARIAPSAIPYRQDRTGLYSLDVIAMAAPASGAPVADARGPSAAMLRAYVDRTLASPPQHAAFERAADRLASKLDMLRRSALPASLLQSGGPAPGEHSSLRYPLYVGAHWAVRESPRFDRVVLARELISLPAGRFVAWRIRNTSELFAPEDRVLFWYSNAGLLRVYIHSEVNAVDNTGNVIGRFEVDEDRALTALHLVAPGGTSNLAVTPSEADADR